MAYLLGLGRAPLFRSIWGFTRERPRAQVPALMLLGDGSFGHRVVIASAQSGWFSEEHSRGEQVHLAKMEFPERGVTGGSGRAQLTIAGVRIGSCPAHIANQCQAWLREWGMEDADVYCRVKTISRRENGAMRHSARLDISQPFMMTTTIPDEPTATL